MFRLPSPDSPLRHELDMDHVVQCLAPENFSRLPTLREAIASAKRSMAENDAIRSVRSIVRKANDEVWLVDIGPRGGWRRRWNFTPRR